MANEKSDRIREVWLLFYGLIIAFLIQIFYDSLSAFGPQIKFAISLLGAVIGLSLLILIFPKVFPKKKS